MPERFLGRTLGKFRIDAVVGTGGFAWVYKAYDPELEIPVALKVLKPQYAGDEQFEQRFRREAATAARLRHPNIIKIFAVGRDGEAVYFAMDFLPQGLPDRLEVLTKLPEPVLVRMGIDVASALGFAHREGVVHRDIKVDNILFDEHGNAIVADFGIARAVSNYVQQTGTDMVVGTPQYFSPEQARGQPLDGRADIYSLGVTLYRAATGVLPFSGDDWYEIARQHVEERPMRPRVHNPLLSRDLERVVLRCLEKDPAARFQTAETLCQALAALSFERNETIAMRSTPSILSSEAPTAPTGWSSTRAVPFWRRPAVAITGATVAIAAVLGGLHVANRAEDPQPHGVAPAESAAAGAGTTSGVASVTDTAGSLASGPAPGAAATAGDRGGAPGAARGAPKTTGAGAGSAAAGAGSAHGAGAHAVAHKGSSRSPGAKGGNAGRGGASASSDPATDPPHPREYGTLHIDAEPAGASYTLKALADGRVLKGSVPLSAPLVLPAGEYAVQISARYCASFRDTVRIARDHQTAPVSVRLVCGLR